MSGHAADAQPRVSIALATYQGRRFLEELLESLEAQDYPSIDIVVSDDGSTDGTREWLAGRTWRRPHRLLEVDERRGVGGNFSRALDACTGPYVALADQDDVWHPQKVSSLFEAVRRVEGESLVPTLAFCDIEIVNAELEPLASSFFAYNRKSTFARRLDDYLIANHVPGCAMLFNRSLLDLARPIPHDFHMHDWWLVMTASALGRIAFVDRPLLRYRQHAANVIGAKARGSNLATKFGKAWRPSAWARFLLPSSERVALVARNVSIFEERYRNRLPPAASEALVRFERAVRSWRGAVAFGCAAMTGERWWYAARLLRSIGQIADRDPRRGDASQRRVVTAPVAERVGP